MILSVNNKHVNLSTDNTNNNNQITQETLLKNSIINLANNLSQAQQANKNNIVQGLMNNNTSNNNRFVDPTSVDSQVLQPNLNSYKNIEKIKSYESYVPKNIKHIN